MSAMYVCVCNVVDEETIRLAVRKGCRSLKCIEEETGAMSECGQCFYTVEDILQDETEKIESGK